MTGQAGAHTTEPGTFGDAGGAPSTRRLFGRLFDRQRHRIGGRGAGPTSTVGFVSGTGDGSGAPSRRAWAPGVSESVAVMMFLPSHAFRSATSRVVPELSPKGAIGGGP